MGGWGVRPRRRAWGAGAHAHTGARGLRASPSTHTPISSPPLPRQVIGATSSLTYNVVGHVKTVIILAGGVVFFGDTMPIKKAGGIAVAMIGIVW